MKRRKITVDADLMVRCGTVKLIFRGRYNWPRPLEGIFLLSTGRGYDINMDKNQKAHNQMIRSLSLYSAGESNSDCKIENLEY